MVSALNMMPHWTNIFGLHLNHIPTLEKPSCGWDRLILDYEGFNSYRNRWGKIGVAKIKSVMILNSKTNWKNCIVYFFSRLHNKSTWAYCHWWPCGINASVTEEVRFHYHLDIFSNTWMHTMCTDIGELLIWQTSWDHWHLWNYMHKMHWLKWQFI